MCGSYTQSVCTCIQGLWQGYRYSTVLYHYDGPSTVTPRVGSTSLLTTVLKFLDDLPENAILVYVPGTRN
jgi:hypothetical protein